MRRSGRPPRGTVGRRAAAAPLRRPAPHQPGVRHNRPEATVVAHPQGLPLPRRPAGRRGPRGGARERLFAGQQPHPRLRGEGLARHPGTPRSRRHPVRWGRTQPGGGRAACPPRGWARGSGVHRQRAPFAAGPDRPGTNYLPVSTEPEVLRRVEEAIGAARDAGARTVVFSNHWGPNMVRRPPRPSGGSPAPSLTGEPTSTTGTARTSSRGWRSTAAGRSCTTRATS